MSAVGYEFDNPGHKTHQRLQCYGGCYGIFMIQIKVLANLNHSHPVCRQSKIQSVYGKPLKTLLYKIIL